MEILNYVSNYLGVLEVDFKEMSDLLNTSRNNIEMSKLKIKVNKKHNKILKLLNKLEIYINLYRDMIEYHYKSLGIK